VAVKFHVGQRVIYHDIVILRPGGWVGEIVKRPEGWVGEIVKIDHRLTNNYLIRLDGGAKFWTSSHCLEPWSAVLRLGKLAE
jgi:hypothetical protein